VRQSEASLKTRKDRLSRRCIRERHLLQMRQVSSVEEAVNYAAKGPDEGKITQILKLTAQLLEVAARNRRLIEVTISMRKKLLSISTLSNMTAGGFFVSLSSYLFIVK
jgi:hypothetical protein